MSGEVSSGAIHAELNFDLERGIKFGTYAHGYLPSPLPPCRV
jgi:DNA-directed RNA polymerase sigma subunit (sigma70/sigma32)